MNLEIQKKNTNAIRGIAAIGIMLTHLGRTITTDGSLLLAFTPIGYLCVGIFFYYSGYNLIYQYLHKLSLPSGFLYSKIKRVYLPFCVGNFVFLAFSYANGEYAFTSFPTLLKNILGFSLLNKTLWYLISILLFYFIFYICFSIHSILLKRSILKKSRKFSILIFALLSFLLYATVYPKLALATGTIPGANECCPLALLTGMAVALYEEKLQPFVRKNKIPLFVFFYLAMTVFHHYNIAGYKLWSPTVNLYNQLAPVFCALAVNILLVNEKIQFQPLQLVGKWSLQLYILHYPFMLLFRSNIMYIQNDYVYFLIYLFTTFTASAVFSFLMEKVNQLLDKLQKLYLVSRLSRYAR